MDVAEASAPQQPSATQAHTAAAPAAALTGSQSVVSTDTLRSNTWHEDAQPRFDDSKSPPASPAVARPPAPPPCLPGSQLPTAGASKAAAAKSKAGQAAMAPSASVLYKRINRTMEPTSQGKFKVCKELRDKWQDLSQRDEVYKLFSDCNNDPD